MDASLTFMTVPKASLTMQGMAPTLGSRIRAARKAQKLTMEEVARALGVSYPAVQQWETDKTIPTVENLTRLQSVVGVALLSDADPVSPENLTRIPTNYDEPNVQWEQGPVAFPKLRPGANDIEEKGITVGGFGDDEFAFEQNGETVDWVRRPPGIVGRANVFALRVSNTSMEPKYDDGERVYVEKRHPAVRDFVVVELHPLGDGRPSKSYIKRLVGINSEKITVEQYNPKGLLEFGRHEVKNLWRVIPEKELRGEA